VDVNRADYESLLRVPGIGVQSARRIVGARRFGRISWDDLKRLGVAMKRARFFVTCAGQYAGPRWSCAEEIKAVLLNEGTGARQLELF
jgi:predicted DNA-binding helix-hairpin-helix protein